MTLSSCSKDDDKPDNGGNAGGSPPETASPSFTCEIDGVTFESQIALLNGSSGFSGMHAWGVTGGRISNGETTIMTLTLTSEAENYFQVGATFNGGGSIGEEHVLGILNGTTNSGGGFKSSSANTEPPATCTITAIDTVTETFSGTFSFEAYDVNNETTRVVSNGVFANVEYD